MKFATSLACAFALFGEQVSAADAQKAQGELADMLRVKLAELVRQTWKKPLDGSTDYGDKILSLLGEDRIKAHPDFGKLHVHSMFMGTTENLLRGSSVSLPRNDMDDQLIVTPSQSATFVVNLNDFMVLHRARGAAWDVEMVLPVAKLQLEEQPLGNPEEAVHVPGILGKYIPDDQSFHETTFFAINISINDGAPPAKGENLDLSEVQWVFTGVDGRRFW